MTKLIYIFIVFFSCFLGSCTTSKNFSPLKKYSPSDLREDYTLLKDILESKHPGIYWYTPKDSMDLFFAKYFLAIKDSMTEQKFMWQVLAPLIDKIHCGHTSVGSSKAYRNWANNLRFPSFPLQLKVWNDTMAVIGNLNRKDSIFKRGTLITSINGVKNCDMIKHMFNFLPEDGFANNVNYIRLSGNFPYYHRNIYGISKNYTVNYLDSVGNEKSAQLPLFVVVKDTSKKTTREKRQVPVRVNNNLKYRSFSIDSSGIMATMTLNTFNKGKLRRFFRTSFSKMRQQNIQNLVLDIRSNGGGKVALSTLLTKYISHKPFKVADTLYAVAAGLGKYAPYIKGGIFNNIEMFFISSRRKDGYYHLGLLERKLYKPKTKNHYNGKTFILTSGPTFSASALFCNAVKGQPGITLLGEETGGGWYGNNGIMIPDIKLPNTKVTIRLPLFKLVQYNHVPNEGQGIYPDIYVGTNYKALLKGEDYKMKVVKDIILKNINVN